MNQEILQNIIAAVIITLAVFCAAVMFWRKVRSFSPKKSSCGTDCGCEGKADREIEAGTKQP